MQEPGAMNERELNELLLSYRRDRDPAAIEALFDATAPRLLRLSMHLAGNPADAEDLLQATWLAVLESADRYEGRGPAIAWMTAILTKQARYAARSRGRTPDPERLERAAERAPEEEAIDVETRTQLERAVAALPQLYRQVVELVLRQGLGPTEIAARTDRSPGAVRTQLHRGIAMLRQALPAGLALPIALRAFESPGVAAVRTSVMERAQQLATTTGARAGLGTAVWVGGAALLATTAVVGVALTWGASGEREPAKGELELEEVTLRSEAPLPVAVVPSRPSRELTATEDPVASRSDPLDVAGGAIVKNGELRLERGDGFSFAALERRDPSAADFAFFEDTLRLSAIAPARVAPLRPLPKRDLDGRPCSADCYLRSIVAFDPDRLRWSEREAITYRRHDLDVFAVQTRQGEYGLIAIAHGARDLESGRWVNVVRWRFAGGAPVFHDWGAVSDPATGVVQDERAFLSDPWRDELDARCAAVLAELDREVETVAARTPDLGAADVHVRGVLSRRFAAAIRADGWDFQSSTYSFEFNTRDDTLRARDDWGFVFEAGAAPWIRVCTASDDRSRIWRLGDLRFDEELAPALALATPAKGAEAVEGELYLIHTNDRGTKRWDLLRVLRADAHRRLLFAWTPLAPGPRLDALQRELRAPGSELAGGEVHVQLRNGARAGHSQAFMDGSTNHRVDELLPSPLDITTPVAMREPSQAYVDGGLIPHGMVLELREIEYWASMSGDAIGIGGFRVIIGGDVLVEVEESEVPESGLWTGSLVLEPGDEQRSYVEISNSSMCDVRFEGELKRAPHR